MYAHFLQKTIQIVNPVNYRNRLFYELIEPHVLYIIYIFKKKFKNFTTLRSHQLLNPNNTVWKVVLVFCLLSVARLSNRSRIQLRDTPKWLVYKPNPDSACGFAHAQLLWDEFALWIYHLRTFGLRILLMYFPHTVTCQHHSKSYISPSNFNKRALFWKLKVERHY